MANKKRGYGWLGALWLLGLPAYGAWTEGDFTGELQWRGSVTHHRNPWLWKQESELGSLSLAQKDMVQEGEQLVWKGLLESSALLLGKTRTTLPAGRAEQVPVVSFDVASLGGELTWEGAGVMRLHLPVSDAAGQEVGRFTFAVRVGAAMGATTGGQRVLAGLYGAEGGREGLPPAGLAIGKDDLMAALGAMMGEDAPAWLQGASLWRVMSLPATALSDVSYRQVDAVYAAQVVAGSGELRFGAGTPPASWRTSLPVRVSYH